MALWLHICLVVVNEVAKKMKKNKSKLTLKSHNYSVIMDIVFYSYRYILQDNWNQC